MLPFLFCFLESFQRVPNTSSPLSLSVCRRSRGHGAIPLRFLPKETEHYGRKSRSCRSGHTRTRRSSSINGTNLHRSRVTARRSRVTRPSLKTPMPPLTPRYRGRCGRRSRFGRHSDGQQLGLLLYRSSSPQIYTRTHKTLPYRNAHCAGPSMEISNSPAEHMDAQIYTSVRPLVFFQAILAQSNICDRCLSCCSIIVQTTVVKSVLCLLNIIE